MLHVVRSFRACLPPGELLSSLLKSTELDAFSLAQVFPSTMSDQAAKDSLLQFTTTSFPTLCVNCVAYEQKPQPVPIPVSSSYPLHPC